MREINFKLAIRVDNSYALFYGDQTGATDYIGAGFSWSSTDVYTFKMPNYRYLYVVSESDMNIA